MMDIFSGILFAAPTSALIAGMFCKGTTSKIAIISTIAGLVCGVIAYFVIQDEDLNWFVGNILSLCLPAVIVIIGTMMSKESFDFNKLLNYVPDHVVNKSEEV